MSGTPVRAAPLNSERICSYFAKSAVSELINFILLKMFQSLQKISGLPIAFNPITCAIDWSEGVEVGETKTRTLAEMKEYLNDKNAAAKTDPIYYMHRGVARTADRDKIKENRLRFDITVIPPGSFDGGKKEFFRTAGHYHEKKTGTDIAYPEIYEVLSGRAYWLLQRPKAGHPEEIAEIYAVEAGPGEKAVMLPGFGHIAVNAYNEALVISDWNGLQTVSDYAPYKSLRGSAYLMVEGSLPGTIEFEKNANYGKVPEIKKLRPKEVPELGIYFSRPLYSSVEDIKKLDYLRSPENFLDYLTVEKCFRPL